MVFGFFARKAQPPPETVPLPPSPTASTSVNVNPSPPSKVEKNVQLRTPSPSVESASVAKVRSASPSTKIARLSIEERQASPTRRGSLPGPNPFTAIAPNPAFVPPEPTVESLTTHIAAIPPKVLHAYVLARIPNVPEDTLPTLAALFAELAPPPKVHCVRCHKDYVEVENDDRSCLVPHDDESAEVERVGTARRAGRVPGTVGATFETLWGCCGKVVEGDGDQGPPDGWCYEGMHTTDIKRARFRADSTPHDDKLVSCLRLNCHGIRATMPRGARSVRKRPRSVNLKEASTEEDESEGEPDSGVDEIVGKTASASGRGRPKGSKNKDKGKGKGKARATAADEDEDEHDQMDVDEPQAESASVAGSVRGRGRPPKSKTQPPGSAAKRRARVMDPRVVPGTDGEDDDDVQSVRSAPTAEAQKRRGRAPKSKATISDSDREAEGHPHTPAKRVSAGKPRTRSLSRTRGGDASDASMGARPKSKARARKVKEANARDDAEAADGDDEKPKKRRRVVDS